MAGASSAVIWRNCSKRPSISSRSRRATRSVPNSSTSNEHTLRRAMTYGSALASFNVEEFGTERVARLERDEIDARFEQFRQITALEAPTTA